MNVPTVDELDLGKWESDDGHEFGFVHVNVGSVFLLIMTLIRTHPLFTSPSP